MRRQSGRVAQPRALKCAAQCRSRDVILGGLLAVNRPRPPSQPPARTGQRPLWKAEAFRYIRFVPQLLLATNNPGKLAELRRLLQGCGWELVSPRALGLDLPDDEPAHTYEENAKGKALNGTRATGLAIPAGTSR